MSVGAVVPMPILPAEVATKAGVTAANLKQSCRSGSSNSNISPLQNDRRAAYSLLEYQYQTAFGHQFQLSGSLRGRLQTQTSRKQINPIGRRQLDISGGRSRQRRRVANLTLPARINIPVVLCATIPVADKIMRSFNFDIVDLLGF